MPRLNEHKERLCAMVDPKQQTWDLSTNDVAAINWALERLERAEALLADLGKGFDIDDNWQRFNLRRMCDEAKEFV